MKIIRSLEKLIDHFMDGVSALAGLMIGAFMVSLFIQVVMRFVFNAPIYGLDELVTALMIWSMALGCATVYWGNEHAVIEAILKHFPTPAKHGVYHLTNLIVLVTSMVYIPGGITLFRMQNRLKPVGGLPFSKAWYYALPVAIMGILLVALAMFKTVGYIVTKDDGMVAPASEDEGGISLD
jgi:TRAP-type C4-dicarboxylate transport system permease small subunit